jgi:tripartite-type tricarboxylate transporter receptor subunit TctC
MRYLLVAGVSIFAFGVAGLAAAPGAAQGYPVKPIRIIVPFAAGGSSDIIARTIGQKFTESWGQQTIIENRAGGSSIIGTDLAARAPADGYTLLLQTIAFAINASLQKKLPYDPVRDFVPITQISALPLMLVVHPSLPVKTVKELVALATARPGQISYASSGSGTSPHIAAEMLKSMAKIDLIHIPYKGNAPAMTDLLGGHVTVNIGLLPVVLPYVNAGKLRALSVTTARRVSALPRLPTMSESGFPDYEINSWQGVFAPARTPPDVVTTLYREIVRILGLPDVRQRLVSEGAEPVGSTPEQFAAHRARVSLGKEQVM